MPLASDPSLALRLDWPLLALSFLFGSIPFGVLVSRVFFKSDIRGSGSGNIGAANALRTLGRKAGIAVLVLDALKGVAAVAVCGPLLSHAIAGYSSVQRIAIADDSWAFAPLHATFAILGHCYTPWLNFKGGKGVATYLGAVFVISWEAGLAFVGVWLLIVLPTGIASAGSMLAAAAAAALVVTSYAGTYPLVLPATGMLASVGIIVYKHRDNLARLRAGTENRLQLLKR
jgi:glycerol-3-phosphate acyltransferase PlsY